MNSWKTALAMAGLALPIAPLQADDFLYRGDCKRADAVRLDRDVNRLLPYNLYRGIQRSDLGDDPCRRDALTALRLAVKQRQPGAAVFQFLGEEVRYEAELGKCPKIELSKSRIAGTVTISIETLRQGSVCEIYISSSWKFDRGPGLAARFDRVDRVVPVDQRSFAVAQSAATRSGLYASPISFVAVP